MGGYYQRERLQLKTLALATATIDRLHTICMLMCTSFGLMSITPALFTRPPLLVVGEVIASVAVGIFIAALVMFAFVSKTWWGTEG